MINLISSKEQCPFQKPIFPTSSPNTRTPFRRNLIPQHNLSKSRLPPAKWYRLEYAPGSLPSFDQLHEAHRGNSRPSEGRATSPRRCGHGVLLADGGRAKKMNSSQQSSSPRTSKFSNSTNGKQLGTSCCVNSNFLILDRGKKVLSANRVGTMAVGSISLEGRAYISVSKSRPWKTRYS